MKILYTIAGFYRPAGMERVLSLKARHFAARGCEVVIVTTEQKGRAPAFDLPADVRLVDLGIGYEDNNGGPLVSKVLGLPFKRLRHRRALRAVLAAERPDVAVSMFCGDEAFLWTDASDSRSVQTVLECHFSRYKRVQYGRRGLWGLADQWRSAREPRLASKFDHFVVLTEEDRGLWLADCPALSRNISVIPNPRTFKPADFAAAEGCAGGSAGADGSAGAGNSICTNCGRRGKTVLAAGRYCYQKGFERLLEAWSLIPEETRAGWTLRIAGDGEDRAALEGQAARLGLWTHASDSRLSNIVLGPSRDMVSEYSRASVFALTSRYEGLPMVLLEAQAAGLPIVSFDCKCGPRDVVSDGVESRDGILTPEGADGFLVREGDVAAFAERLSQLMTDAELRERMSGAATEASERFDEELIMKKWEDLLIFPTTDPR